jgi:ribonuclease R
MPPSSQLSSDNILRFLQVRRDPATTDQIAAALHMRRADRHALHKMLSTLKKRRAIEELPGGRFRLAGRREERSGDGQRREAGARRAEGSQAAVAQRPAAAREGGGVASRNEIKGRLVLHHDGYGFVVPDPPVPWLDRDVFIPRDAVEDAMHGDQVLVKMQRVTGAGESQRTEGRIVRVLGRAHATVVGLFRYGARGNSVLPYDARMQHEIEIPPGMELTPGLAKKLGFSGADERSVRGRRIPRLEELDGAVVNVEVVRYPRGGMAATGRVIEILGRPGELGVDTEIIIRKHHLPHVFPAEVMKEADKRALPVQEAELAGREDFRRLPIVTIDGETARDFDDAVYVERRVDGGWYLQVHIADVAHYVRALTQLDGEARLRGTSVYFPDRAVPMLPEALSNGVCSLKPR